MNNPFAYHTPSDLQNKWHSRADLVIKIKSMVYSSKGFECLFCLGKRTEETIRFLYQASLTVGSYKSNIVCPINNNSI